MVKSNATKTTMVKHRTTTTSKVSKASSASAWRCLQVLVAAVVLLQVFLISRTQMPTASTASAAKNELPPSAIIPPPPQSAATTIIVAQDDTAAAAARRLDAEQQDQELLRIQSCDDVLQRMLSWNDCWRRFVLNHHNQNETSSRYYFRDHPISCPLNLPAGTTPLGKTRTSLLTETIGAPLYHTAYYDGQGFGRVVAHTVKHCLMAFLLQRPCLIHFTPRDPAYTWRSFLQEGSYRWDPGLLHFLSNGNYAYADQLEQLTQRIPTKASNDWEGSIQVSEYDNRDSLVFPMETKFPPASWNDAIQYYHGTHPSRGNQVLVSPNWGVAWHTRIPMDEILKDQYHCKKEPLTTMVQNAMYRPTDLTWQLHQPRVATALTTAWKDDTSDTTNGATTPRNNAVMTTHNSMKSAPVYGAVHIRLYFINLTREQRGEPPITKEELAEMLQACLDRASMLVTHYRTDTKFPRKWWFLGDNAPMTVQVADEIQNQQREHRQSAGKQLPRLQIFHDYNATNTQPSLQSKNEQANGLYGHALLAGSMQDWMVLQQSTVAVVMRDGAFGVTGARGNGKMGTEFCGKPGSPQTPFQIFLTPG